MTRETAQSLDIIHSIDYNTQRACYCVCALRGKALEHFVYSVSLSFHHGKLLVISSLPPIAIINPARSLLITKSQFIH